MLSRLAFLALSMSTALHPTSANAEWTYCVGESATGKDIWITSVFAAERDREKLEADFQALLKRLGVARPVVQCPAPKGDKTDMLNDQTNALEFHKKLGDALHAVAPSQFETRR